MKFRQIFRQRPWREMMMGGILLVAFLVLYRFAETPQQMQNFLPAPTSTIQISTSEVPIKQPESTPPIPPKTPPQSFVGPPTVFVYSFNTNDVLYEADNINDSSSPYWWVDSGAEFITKNNVGSTILGALSAADPWRERYAKDNPLDTDNGYHPQNIFRLVSKYEWNNYIEEAYFKIDAQNLSASPNRNESNGLLLFNRYRDAFDLYYAGIRVDGNAVIKKKTGGTYYTMAQNPIFPGDYDPVTAPNLIPIATWIGIRTRVVTTASSTNIKLYLDIGQTGNWILVASANDNGTHYGGKPINGPAHLGIRTDFMDVEFKAYKVTKL